MTISHSSGARTRTIFRFGIPAAIVGVAIYWAVNALDARIAALATGVQVALVDGATPWQFIEWEGGVWSDSRLVDALLRFVLLSMFVGGLPLGLIGIAVDGVRRWKGRRGPLFGSGYYACLSILLFSSTVSIFFLWTFLLAAFDGAVGPGDWPFITYFGPQLIVAVWSLRAWRRLFHGDVGLAAPMRALLRDVS